METQNSVEISHMNFSFSQISTRFSISYCMETQFFFFYFLNRNVFFTHRWELVHWITAMLVLYYKPLKAIITTKYIKLATPGVITIKYKTLQQQDEHVSYPCTVMHPCTFLSTFSCTGWVDKIKLWRIQQQNLNFPTYPYYIIKLVSSVRALV